jgi:hypothetical protein
MFSETVFDDIFLFKTEKFILALNCYRQNTFPIGSDQTHFYIMSCKNIVF